MLITRTATARLQTLSAKRCPVLIPGAARQQRSAFPPRLYVGKPAVVLALLAQTLTVCTHLCTINRRLWPS